MLSPSKLFFGTPDPEPPPDEKPIWGDGDMWQDSDDADERCTDVPVDAHEPSDEQNLETSLNESEEERRSPLGPGASAAAADHLQRAAPSSFAQQRVPNGPPPGLPLLQQDDCLRSPTTMKPVLESSKVGDGDSDDEEEADDERHSSDEFDDMNGIASGRGLGPVPEGALRYSELPSIGSANHFSGNCDRCCFHPKGRCLNGFNCQHCHFDHEKRKRKNKKKNKSKQLQSLNGDDDMGMISDSAYGSSLPVSPDAPFIGGMLPQEYRDDFPVSTSLPSTPAGFLPQQPQYYAGLDAGARPPSVGASLGENKWFQTATGTAQQASPPGVLPPPMQDNSNFISAPPPGYDFPGQMPGVPCQTLPGSPAENGYGVNQLEMEARYPGEQLDRREEYIRQLEAENRYLRTCLVQCLGPNATALSLLPPPPGGPPQQSFFRPAEGLNMSSDEVDTGPLPFSPCPPPPPGVPAPMPPGAALASGPVLAPTTTASQGLSPSAPPFWPAWQDPGDLVDTSRFDAPPHHPPSFEQVAVPLHQDADGQMLATTGVLQHLGGH